MIVNWFLINIYTNSNIHLGIVCNICANNINNESSLCMVCDVCFPLVEVWYSYLLESSKTLKITELIRTQKNLRERERDGDWWMKDRTANRCIITMSTPSESTICLNSGNFVYHVKLLTCSPWENRLAEIGKHTTSKGHQNIKRGTRKTLLQIGIAINSTFWVLMVFFALFWKVQCGCLQAWVSMWLPCSRPNWMVGRERASVV